MATQLYNNVWVGLPIEINEFSAFGEMLLGTKQTEHRQVDCSKVEGRQ